MFIGLYRRALALAEGADADADADADAAIVIDAGFYPPPPGERWSARGIEPAPKQAENRQVRHYPRPLRTPAPRTPGSSARSAVGTAYGPDTLDAGFTLDWTLEFV
ncbi:hypothetical protein [Rhodococcus sp. H29-C3]|uniref:hypothetical protein n=1 Tax=Rhodococcus sp. H29-C3 TaxID=3046307 RepID=UPI0024B8C0E0|nr:hypothetical protein [Rhodococcus sp. H29-C3]MDJ0363118.1 hypothetical protein [Rhodococcus sp. H29-C3]